MDTASALRRLPDSMIRTLWSTALRPHRDPAWAETVKTFPSAGTAVAGENCRDTWNKNQLKLKHITSTHMEQRGARCPDTLFWKHVLVSKDALVATTFSLGRTQKARIWTAGAILRLTDSSNDTVPLVSAFKALAVTFWNPCRAITPLDKTWQKTKSDWCIKSAYKWTIVQSSKGHKTRVHSPYRWCQHCSHQSLQQTNTWPKLDTWCHISVAAQASLLLVH